MLGRALGYAGFEDMSSGSRTQVKRKKGQMSDPMQTDLSFPCGPVVAALGGPEQVDPWGFLARQSSRLVSF